MMGLEPGSISEAPGSVGSMGAVDLSESQLVERLRAGDERACEQLVRCYGGRMLATAKRILRNQEDARDAVQEAFISALGGIKRFEGGAQVSTWLHRIVINAALMKLRGRKRRAEDSIEDLLPKFTECGHQEQPASEWRQAPDTDLEREEVRTLVRASIERLPETYRTVLLLRDIEELDTAETAAALGITENAVKIRLHRARQALRELLDPGLRG